MPPRSPPSSPEPVSAPASTAIRTSPTARADLAATAALATTLAEHVLSDSTLRNYGIDWARFEAWCQEHGQPALSAPPEAVALHLASLVREGLAMSSIQRAVAGITHFQKKHDPEWNRGHRAIRAVLAGARRQLGVATEKKAAIATDALRLIVERRPLTRRGALERAVLLVGWASALRRENLAALDVRDVAFVPEGLRLMVRRSKTDQVGRGRVVAIIASSDPDVCPVRALRRWLELIGKPTDGPLFRAFAPGPGGDRVTTGRIRAETIARIVKRAAKDAGFEPADVAGHSLRRGFATSAAAAGVDVASIQRQTGHKDLRILIEHYITPATAFHDNATDGLLDGKQKRTYIRNG